jgi:hypothetical protein
LVLEGSDALKVLAITFGLAGVILYLVSGMFCHGQDVTCRIQAIGVLLNSIGGRIFALFILLVIVVALLSVKPKAGSEKKVET